MKKSSLNGLSAVIVSLAVLVGANGIAAEKSTKEKPVSEKPAKDKPVAEKLTKEKSAAEKVTKDKPVAEKPTKEKAEKPAKEKLDLTVRDTRTELDKNMAQAKEGHDRLQKEKEAEAMRDKTHDGRLKVGEKTSIGVQGNPPGVNIKVQTP